MEARVNAMTSKPPPQPQPTDDPEPQLPAPPPSMYETSLPFRDEDVTDGVTMHWPESGEGEMTFANASSAAPSKVEGPIRCHKCQLMCRDAKHYLSHLSRECERKP